MATKPRLAPGRCKDAGGIVEGACGPAFSTDSDHRVIHWNEEAASLLGYQPEWARGQFLGKLLDPRDVHGNPLDGSRFDVWDLIGRGEPVRPFEVSYRTAFGARVRANVSMVIVLEPSHHEFELVYLLQPTYRRRRSDEVIERILSSPRGTRGDELIVPGAQDRSSAERSDEGGGTELTKRQLQVLRLLAEGESTQAIAKHLRISIYTVRSHLQAILARLGVHSQVEAVARAHREHLL